MLGLGSSIHKATVAIPYWKQQTNKSIAGAEANGMDTENPNYLGTRILFYTEN
jgi:hypothetical protein